MWKGKEITMEKNPRRIQLAVLNLIAFIGVLVVNYLATALPINGNTTGDLSAMYPNLFVPAGFTFSIWGIIYLTLLIFTLTTLVRALMGKRDLGLQKIGIFFFLSCLANVSWILAWHYTLVPLSLLIMLCILGSVLAVYLRLGIGTAKVSALEKLVVHLPFSLYLGWITIATVANFTTLLVDMGWNGFGISESTWTVIMLGIASAIGLFVVIKRRDFFYALVLIWAFFGIFSKRQAVEPVVDSVVLTSQVVMGLAALGLVVAAVLYFRLPKAQSLS